MTTTDEPTVRDLVEDAIVILENRIGTDDEEASDQMALCALNDAHLAIRVIS